MTQSFTNTLVTGAGGFVGLHLVLHLLQQGDAVRGTVRTQAHAARVRATLAPHVPVERLELVCADLVQDAGWAEAMRGITEVYHVASPFPAANPRDENELLVPARDGTLRVLRAAHAAGVRRVVLVSSVSAIIEGHQGENRTFSEADWTDMQKTPLTYARSKTAAEQAAWTFVRGPENTGGMELVSINPVVIFGPVLDNHMHSSIEWYRTLLHREAPGVPDTQLDVVDVRDLVEVMRKAMVTPGAAGSRYLVSGASIRLPAFAQILAEHFAGRGYRVPTAVLPGWLFKGIALLMPKARGVAAGIGWRYTLSTQALESTFGWQPRPYRQTIIEMAESLVAQKMV